MKEQFTHAFLFCPTWIQMAMEVQFTHAFLFKWHKDDVVRSIAAPRLAILLGRKCHELPVSRYQTCPKILFFLILKRKRKLYV